MSQGGDSLVVLTINHETAPLAVRETYAVADEDAVRLYELASSTNAAEELLVLNTCNRFELYARLREASETDTLVAAIADFHGKPASELEQVLHLRSGREAIQHLIEVSAGLRSQITGEVEIFGQVKVAYATSKENGYTGKALNRIFQKGFQAAKLIRNSTQIGEGQINISNVAVELAGKIFGSLANAATLSLGTGEIGEKTVKALRSRGARRFGIASRQRERAESIVGQWGGRPHTIADLETYLPEYDIVIASVGTEQAILNERLVERGLGRRDDRPLFLIDLGLPRNIEQACGELDNVFLYNLDDLAAIADENLQERRNAMPQCQRIAAQKAQLIWESLQKRGLT